MLQATVEFDFKCHTLKSDFEKETANLKKKHEEVKHTYIHTYIRIYTVYIKVHKLIVHSHLQNTIFIYSFIHSKKYKYIHTYIHTYIYIPTGFEESTASCRRFQAEVFGRSHRTEKRRDKPSPIGTRYIHIYTYIQTYIHTHILKALLHACVHAYFYKDTHLYHISIHVNNVTKIFKYMHTYEF